MRARRLLRRLASVLSVAGAAALGAATPASAAVGLAPVAPLYQGSLLMQSPVVAMDGASRAVVVWFDFGAGQQLLSRTYVNGQWSAVEPLPRGAGSPGDYRLVMDRAGNATATWKSSTGGVSRLESVRRAPGGQWSAPEFVTDAGVTVNGHDLAVAPDGAVTVAWSAGAARELRVRSRPADGQWSAAESPGNRAGLDPDVALDVDAAGGVGLLFARDTAGGREVEVATRPVGGGWDVSGLGAITQAAFTTPEIALGDGGEAVAAWEHDIATDASQVSVSHRPAGGAFSPMTALAPADADAGRPGVAVTADGRAVAVWRDGKEKAIKTSTRARGDGDWSPAVTTGGAGASVAVLGDDGRRVHVNVLDSTSGGTPKWAMHDGAGFTGFTPADPGATGMQAAMAFDGAGNGMLAWLRLGRTEGGEVSGFDVVARAIDATPPDIETVSTPARVAAGEAATFAVQAADRFSSGTAAWDFGDGTGAAGPTQQHAYGAPGIYTGRVMVADQHGNAAVRAFTVEVTAAAAGARPGSPAGDRTKPTVRLSGVASRVRAGWLLSKPRIAVRTNEAAAIRVRVRAGKTTIATAATAGRRTMRLRLAPTRAGRKRLTRLRRPARMVVLVTAKDLAGNVRSVRRTITVRR